MNLSSCFTPQGRQLSIKLHVGSALTITRVIAGAGKTPPDGAVLSAPMQALSLLPFRRDGNTISLPATLLALQAQGDYRLTELGVYAQDPDLGEILYKICSLDAPLAISPHSPLILRFYLKEILTQNQLMPTVLYPDGVLLQPDLAPVQNKVNAAAVPTTKYTMDITAVQAFLDALPRLLTENLEITVSGTLNTRLRIAGFYGSGNISVIGASQGACVLAQGVSMERCTVSDIAFSTVDIAGPGMETYYATALMSACRFLGPGTVNSAGVAAKHMSMIHLLNCSFQNWSTAVLARSGTVISMDTCSGTGNTYGLHAFCGGVILLAGSTPDLLGGTANIHGGGIITSANGTLI